MYRFDLLAKKQKASEPTSTFVDAWQLIEILHRFRCIYFEDSTAGSELNADLKRRCDAVVEELKETRRMHNEIRRQPVGQNYWFSRTELERETLELRREACQMIEFCCDMLIEDKSLMAHSLMKPLKDQANILALETNSQKRSVEESINKLYPPITVCPDTGRYDMSGRRLALMICVLQNRDGAVRDMRRMRNIFRLLGFHYNIEINPTKQGIDSVIRKFRDSLEKRPNGVSCCVVVIMAHGGEGHITASDGGKVKLEDVFEKFNNRQCPGLREKPKAFIIQACRTAKDVDTRPPCHGHQQSCCVNSRVKLPSISDTFIVYSVCPGKLAWRHREKGCRLTEEMENAFSEHYATHSMFELFTQVNGRLDEGQQCTEKDLASNEYYELDRAPQFLPFNFTSNSSYRAPRNQAFQAATPPPEDKVGNCLHIQSNLTKKWYLCEP